MMRIRVIVLMARGMTTEMSLLAQVIESAPPPPWTELRGDGGGAPDRGETVQPVKRRVGAEFAALGGSGETSSESLGG